MLCAFRVRARAGIDTASPPINMFEILPNIGELEIFAGVGFKESQSRSQNVGSTYSALVLLRFPLVDANFFLTSLPARSK